jgi:chemotaxis protein CheZ
MMSRSETTELRGCIEALMAEGSRSLSAGELSDIIGEVARTLTADLGSLGTPSAAVAAPADTSHSAVALSALEDLGTVDKGPGPLSDLWHELDQIRLVTQDAAAKYLACAEKVEIIAERPDLEIEDQDMFARMATDMFEATAFQDLTGQRLTRIGEILRQIEFHVASAKADLGDSGAASIVESLSEGVEKTEHRKVEYILHGPQDAGTANTQEEIDKILASFD